MRKVHLFMLTLTFGCCLRLSAQSDAASYFTNVILVDQYQEEMYLYDDLLRDQVVLVHAFYSQDHAVTPVLLDRAKRIQDYFGSSITILSITVDSQTDTPEVIQQFATRMGIQDNWYLLTGEPENVEFALQRLGLHVSTREQMSNVFIMGNVPTGLWKRAMGLSAADQLIELMQSVVDNRN